MRFTFKAGGTEFDVVSFELDEGLSQPFTLSVDLASTDPSIDFGAVLDQPAQLTIWRADQPVRYVHGLVSDFEQGDTGFRRTRYRAVVEPKLARTGLCADWRIFQRQSVPDILSAVLKEHEITDYELLVTETHLPREYCVQAGDSDLHFLARLAAEEGFYYAFAFADASHRLVHGDNLYIFGSIDGGPVEYNATPGGDQPTPALRRLRYSERVRTARQTQRDYTFKHPTYTQEHQHDGAQLDHQSQDYEVYQFPGRYKEDAAGRPFTRTRLLGLRGDARTAEVEGDDARLVPGLAFDLTGHPRADLNRGWRPLRIRHRGVQHTSQAEESADAQQGTHYSYTAELIPDDVEWRPAPMAKPRIDGPQVAIVVGPPGEEIHCDEWGRVKVQFTWDRQGKSDEHSSCWIRVSQNWAGATWGHVAIPRISQEVLVGNIDGDCDQPIIIGRTYMALQRPPYELPKHNILSTIKSKEHKAGRNNELLFDDTNGEISATLRSDQGASALNLGYLVHPRPGGGKARGKGFELRTDEHGAVRAGSGLLLTTEPRPHASEHHKDLKETAARLHVAGEQQEGFGTQAREVQAQEAGDQDAVAKALQKQHQGIVGNGPGDPASNDFPEFAQPYVVVASPVGIATSTPGSTHIASGEHIALSSTEHISLTSGKRLLASASRGMRLFVQSLGYRLIAAAGDIDIRALKDSINLLAKLNITHTAERITLNAKTELVINGGGSATVYNAGGITHQTSGRYTGHAAKFSYTGPKSRAASFPEPPKPGQGNLELFNRYASSFANGAGIAGGTYEVEDAMGKVFKGALDGVGHNVVAGAAPGPARVHYGKDPADTFAMGSYFGGPTWPEAPQQGVAQRAQALSGPLIAAQQAVTSQPVANVLGNLNQGAGNLIGTGLAVAGQLAASTSAGKALTSAAGLLGSAREKVQNGVPSAADAGRWLTGAAGGHTYTVPGAAKADPIRAMSTPGFVA
ncbi:type VI secretion system Vgr family protein [Burkholderia cepacia]|uniref:type VI secretion system Vgr family protein n=1 Tax=Burkholderia cepacia TaxID=292 RepID=UPI001CF105E8|nr:type VI secretion system tip protein TssI/VgrG [Burkholderia cepacia]MCA8115541.1 type VI secretion system tip protein VgrG [Burkholderia cepacia]MCA8402510.1 type VI secretion system tip protein VgrG [Burkholderia cepacia]